MEIVGSDVIQLTVSDIIQIASIMIALFLGVISIIISVAALKQNTKIIKEGNKAQIEIFPFKIYGDIVPRIKIQNFGASTGIITDVKTIPEMPTNNIIINPFEFYKGLSLAPSQSFTTVFSKEDMANVPIEEFDVILTYNTLEDRVESKFHINYKFLDGSFETNSSSKDPSKALDKINQSIQGLLQK